MLVAIGFVKSFWAIAFEASASFFCSSVWQKMVDRYCGPRSPPWPSACVGSWAFQNHARMVSVDIFSGS